MVHALVQQIFRNNPNCNWEVSGSYRQLQLDSAALSIPISPSPKSRRPRYPLVLSSNRVTTQLLCPPTYRGIRL